MSKGVSERGETPLHIAAGKRFLTIAKLLVETGADVNAAMEEKPGEEATVLSLAALSDKPEIVQMLLGAGAEVEPEGDLLIEAERRGSRGAAKVLLQAQECSEKVKRPWGSSWGAEVGF
jgi:ankyrin repeat protein